MAVTPMKFISIVGHMQDFDRFVRSCIINKEFHPERAASVMHKSNILFSFDEENPYIELLRFIEETSAETGLDLGYGSFEKCDFTVDDIRDYVEKFRKKYEELKNERERLELLISDNTQIILQLEHVRDVNAELQDFWTFAYSKFRFGRMPRAIYESFESQIRGLPDLFFFLTSIDRDYAYGMYITPSVHEEKSDSLFNSLQFERIYIPRKISGTADESIASLTAEIEDCKRELSEVAKWMQDFLDSEMETFRCYYSYIRYHNEAFEMRRYAAHTKESFYLMGWVPEESLEAFKKELDEFGEITYVVKDAVSVGNECPPPIKLKNSRLFKPFEQYVRMYGLPKYNEMDCSALLASTYTLLFGIMFGDVGQGLLVVLIGFLMWKLKGMWLGRILIYAGVSSTLFGFVYNSVFGYEELLPYHGFKVLDGDNTNTMLLLAVFAGMLLISVAMILNIVNGFRQKNFTKCLFSPNGIAGFAFYWALILAILPMLGFGENRLSLWYILIFVMIPFVLMFLREPLGKLVEKRPDWKPRGVGGFIVENLFEMVEILLSFVTNTISFLRVGAFALSHAGMMMVVFLLAGGTSESQNIFVIIIGNLVVSGIEGLLVGIQVLRLEFYELFGRFYEGGGQPYTPVVINYDNKN